jgi:hypothetical protein
VCTSDGNELGTITVDSKQELANIAAADWRPIFLGDRLRSFRYLGYRVEPTQRDGTVKAFLWVSEAVVKKWK